MAKINKKTDKSNFFLSFLFYKYIIFNQRMRNEHTRNTWRIRICGHDKSAPTAADGLPITLRTICGYVIFV